MYTETETYYYADDHKKFEDEDKCIAYEKWKQNNGKFSDIHLWDENFDEIYFTYSENFNIDKVSFFKCDTNESFDFFVKITEIEFDEDCEDEKTELFFYSDYEDGVFMTINRYEQCIDDLYYKAKSLEKFIRF